VPGKVERVDGVVGCQGGSGEQPVVEIATEAVDEHDGLAALALTQVSQRPGCHLDSLRRSGGVLPGFAGNEGRLELRHEGINVRIRHIRLRDHAEEPADGNQLTGRGNASVQDPGDRALHGTVELVGLDFGHLIADSDDDALIDQPFDQAALRHRQAPLGHRELMDFGGHAEAARVASATSRTTPAIWSGLGT
jgi:hypothetical protein